MSQDELEAELQNADPTSVCNFLRPYLLVLSVEYDPGARTTGHCGNPEAACFRGTREEVCKVLAEDDRFGAKELASKFAGYVKTWGKEWPRHLSNLIDIDPGSPPRHRIVLSIDNSNWNQDDIYYTAYFRELILRRLATDFFECTLQRRAVRMPT